MNFKEIVDDALDKCDYDASLTSSGPRTRFKRLVNQWHRQILARPEFSRLRDSPITFATVLSQAQYGLPPSIGRINRIYDATTSNPRLVERTLDWLRDDTRADLNTGTPRAYVPIGLRPITRLPVSTGVWAVSDSAADTTQAIRMDAVRSGGYVFQAGPSTINGLTRVQIGTRSDYVDVQKLYLSAACAGDISIYDAAVAGNLLAVIPIGKLFAQYFVIQLWQVPSSVITYTVEAECKVFDMVQDFDESLFPEDYGQILSMACKYEEMLKKEKAGLARIYKVEQLETEVSRMLDWLVNHPDYVVVPDDGRGRRGISGSNLGPWFPSGRW